MNNLKRALTISLFLVLASCEGKNNNKRVVNNRNIKFETDTSNTITLVNKSKIKTSTFCIHPRIGESTCYIEINNNDTQGKKIKLSENYQVLFSSNNLIHYIIKNNDSLKIIDANETNIGYKIKGIKDTLRDNEILFFDVCYKNRIPLMMEESFNEMLHFLKKNELRNNFKKLSVLYKADSLFAMSYFSKYSVSKKFRSYILDYIKFDFFNKIYTYINDKHVLDSLNDLQFFNKRLDETNEYNVANFKFYYYLINDFKYKLKEIYRTKKVDTDSIFNFIESNYSPNNAQYLKFYYLKMNLDSLARLNKDYAKNKVMSLANEEERKMLMDRMKDKEESEIGSDVIINQEGKKLSLADIILNNKNKVIFIDFWASWCRPCIKEFKYYSELKKEMGTADIRFIFISIDRSKNDWLKALLSEKLDSYGENYLLSKPSVNLKKRYNISTIPNYILFDKSAKIITIDAPRPSNPWLKPLLLKQLTK